jgi:hypothetical protein
VEKFTHLTIMQFPAEGNVNEILILWLQIVVTNLWALVNFGTNVIFIHGYIVFFSKLWPANVRPQFEIN